MKLTARLLREPLLHFLAIGGLIFLLFGALAGPGFGRGALASVTNLTNYDG